MSFASTAPLSYGSLYSAVADPTHGPPELYDDNRSRKNASNHSSVKYRIDGRDIQRVNWPSIKMFASIVIFLALFFNIQWIMVRLVEKAKQDEDRDKVNNSPEYFDYIVVGGGPAGIITAVNLASRIDDSGFHYNEDGHRKRVLLLESGTLSQSGVLSAMQKRSMKEDGEESRILNDKMEEFNVFSMISSQTEASLNLNAFDVPLLWNSLSTMNKMNTFDSFESFHHWPIQKTFLGRALGGSGVHNAMINIRALPSDFRRWNVSKWSPEEMMPYFNKLESYDRSTIGSLSFWRESQNEEKIPFKRGTSGPLKCIPGGTYIDPAAPIFVEASLESGISLASLGFNSPGKRIGAGYYEYNIRDGIRDSVASAFLSADGNGRSIPDNLHVRTGATVLKILTEQTNVDDTVSVPEAVGVRYLSSTDGRVHEVYLNPRSRLKQNGGNMRAPEVILSAGAILTPQLLANSGIHAGGVVADIPGVGKNVQDHPVIPVSFQIEGDLLEGPSIYSVAQEENAYLQAVQELARMETFNVSLDARKEVSERLGVFSSAGFSAGAFLCSPYAEDGIPDIQLTVFPRNEEPHFLRKEMKSNSSEKELPTMLITVALIRMEGRYEVKLASNENDHPNKASSQDSSLDSTRIKFEETLDFMLPSIGAPEGEESLKDTDVERLAWGIEQVRRIKTFPPLSENSGEEINPGSALTDSDLNDFIRKNVMQNSHWAGSTKIGTDDDPGAVVDEYLRVRGVKNLRVVDAGVMPFVPNGNTHSTVCVVALRAVDLILG